MCPATRSTPASYVEPSKTSTELLQFLRSHKVAVQASVTPSGTPQAAVVGYAVSDALEIIFDTVDSSRKLRNLQANPRAALVIGWDDEITVQLEGIADFPRGDRALDSRREA